MSVATKHELNNFRRAIKFGVHRYPEIKVKAKDATNTDSWGPSTEQKNILSDACYDDADREIVLRALLKRIRKAEKPIHVSKALDCLCHIVTYGPFQAYEEIKKNRSIIVNLSLVTPAASTSPSSSGSHQSVINMRMERLLELLDNPHMIEEARERAAQIREKLEAPAAVSSSASPVPSVSPEPSRASSGPTTPTTEMSVTPTPTTTVNKPVSPPSAPACPPPPPPAPKAAPPTTTTTTTALDDVFSQPITFVQQQPVTTVSFGAMNPPSSPPPPPVHPQQPPAADVSSASNAPPKTLVDLDNLFGPSAPRRDVRSLNEMRLQKS
eukprot:PhM_4_TR11617/c1_g1_i1/m.9786/K12471/EPN; epsin